MNKTHYDCNCGVKYSTLQGLNNHINYHREYKYNYSIHSGKEDYLKEV